MKRFLTWLRCWVLDQHVNAYHTYLVLNMGWGIPLFPIRCDDCREFFYVHDLPPGRVAAPSSTPTGDQQMTRKKKGHARREPRAKQPSVQEIRRAFADYVWSGGCSCCSVPDKLREAEARIAKLLRIPKFSDGSGYNISRFRTSTPGDDK